MEEIADKEIYEMYLKVKEYLSYLEKLKENLEQAE